MAKMATEGDLVVDPFETGALLLRAAYCPICEELFSEEILQCPQGHSSCGTCWDRWLETKRSCPHCRTPVGQRSDLVRNRQLEQLIEELNDKSGLGSHDRCLSSSELVKAKPLTITPDRSSPVGSSSSGSSLALNISLRSASASTSSPPSMRDQRPVMVGAAALRPTSTRVSGIVAAGGGHGTRTRRRNTIYGIIAIVLFLRMLAMWPQLGTFYSGRPSVAGHLAEAKRVYFNSRAHMNSEFWAGDDVFVSDASSYQGAKHIPPKVLLREVLYYATRTVHFVGIVAYTIADIGVWIAALVLYMATVTLRFVLIANVTVFTWLVTLLFRSVQMVVQFLLSTKEIWFGLITLAFHLAFGFLIITFKLISWLWSLCIGVCGWMLAIVS